MDIRKLKRQFERLQKTQFDFRDSPYFTEKDKNLQSSFFEKYSQSFSVYGNLKFADRGLNRGISCETLRRVSQKAWLINLCITSIQRKVRPFLQVSQNKSQKGFMIQKINQAENQIEKRKIEEFVLNCGIDKNTDRDDFLRFGMKLVRDLMEIDQVATEIVYSNNAKIHSFYAVDGATIRRVLPDQPNEHNIKYVQIIDGIPTAYYPSENLLFDYQNPRTDIENAFYGYSYVEQAIDLITSSINAFTYNAGFFTENKLPRGMLLLDGTASRESIEDMEDYLAEIMSGSPVNQWRVPILSAGNASGGGSESIKWISLSGTNREMEFQNWLDFLSSSIVSLFGSSMEELGLHSSKSQPLFEHNSAPQIEETKSVILGDILGFMQRYINKIVQVAFPEYEFVFVGLSRDDPKAILEISKMEVETYKTLNELRKEKGFEPIAAKWADSCPANPQFVQMFQADQANGDEGGDDSDDMDKSLESAADVNKSHQYSRKEFKNGIWYYYYDKDNNFERMTQCENKPLSFEIDSNLSEREQIEQAKRQAEKYIKEEWLFDWGNKETSEKSICKELRNKKIVFQDISFKHIERQGKNSIGGAKQRTLKNMLSHIRYLPLAKEMFEKAGVWTHSRYEVLKQPIKDKRNGKKIVAFVYQTISALAPKDDENNYVKATVSKAKYSDGTFGDTVYISVVGKKDIKKSEVLPSQFVRKAGVKEIHSFGSSSNWQSHENSISESAADVNKSFWTAPKVEKDCNELSFVI